MKIVFDVPDDHVVRVVDLAAQDGFTVQEYYDAHRPRPVRGVPHGFTRMGAQRPRRSFTLDEVNAARSAFEALTARCDLPAEVVGVDTWEAGGGDGDGLTGVREPRRPRPRSGPVGAELRPDQALEAPRLAVTRSPAAGARSSR